jgi:hypothetical protein
MEIFSLVLLSIVLITYIFILKEIIGMRKIINRMLKRSRKYKQY